jgi:hypothetical protein
MKRGLPVLLIALAMVFGSLGISHATVLTFDDIGGGDAPVNNGYGGLNWSNMYYLNGTSYPIPDSGYHYGRVSGDYVAYNGWGSPAVVSDTEFDFNGAYLTGAWNNDLNINVIGYLNGVEQYNQTVVVDVNAPTWFTFNYLGIDSLYFNSYGGVDSGTGGAGEHFAMDNFTFNESVGSNPVPEPATIILFGTGLVGLAGRKFRRKEA